MSATHEAHVRFCLATLRADHVLKRSTLGDAGYAASVLIGYLVAMFGVNRHDALIAATSAIEIAQNDLDIAKLRAKA